MNRTDLILAALALGLGVGCLFLSNAGTTLLASLMLRSQGATAALAYLDNCCDYYNYGGVSPADVNPNYPTSNYAPDYYSSDAGSIVESNATEYYGGPLDNTQYWSSDASFAPVTSDETWTYGDPIFSSSDYPSDYTVETVDYYDDTPWYYSSFPGFGQFVTPILPPIVRPTPAPQPVAPQPTCSIAAQPTVVPYGGSAVVNWTSYAASAAALSGVGGVPASGSRGYPNLTAPLSVTLTVSGQGGTNTCGTTIQVQPPQTQPQPGPQQNGRATCVLSAHPTLIARGQSASLAWMSQNAEVAYLGGGMAPLSGGVTVSPAQSTTYTLTVYDAGGAASACTAGIAVQ